MEAFYTLQGEGFHQGKAAYFIRLGGCNVGCFWCDVKESWDANQYSLQTIPNIVNNALQYATRIAVITGGEPLLHSLQCLTQQLQQHGFCTHLETSGSSPLSGTWNWICLSPKKFKPPIPEVIHAANELKIIVYNKHDFKWAEKYAAQVSPSCRLYLQPEWSKLQENMPLILSYIEQHPQWQLSLQMHKYLNIP
jgi:organic radical activating enzyme